MSNEFIQTFETSNNLVIALFQQNDFWFVVVTIEPRIAALEILGVTTVVGHEAVVIH